MQAKVNPSRYAAWAGFCLLLLLAMFGLLVAVAPEGVPEGEARLTVQSEPAAAILLVDDKSLGETGSDVHPVTAGKHSILVRKDGYVDASQDVELASREQKTVEVRLCRSKARKICKADDVWWADGCDTPQELVEHCANGATCRDGECSKPCAPRTAKRCVGNDIYWFDSCNKQGEQAEKCAAGSSCKVDTCVAECTAHASKRCVGDEIYWFDSCEKQQDVAARCKTGETCAGDKCVTSCTPDAARRCVGDDVYWFDSCGKQQEIADDCKAGETCSGDKCVTSCTGHAAKRCVGNKLYWFDSCEKQQDVAASCKSGEVCTDDRCVSSCTGHASKRCVGSKVYWFDSCEKQQEVAASCKRGETCNGDRCEVEVKQEAVPKPELKVEPKPESTPATKEAKGTCNTRGAKRCVGGTLYWADSCDKSVPVNPSCTTGLSCSGDRCESSCSMHGSKRCVGNDLYWFDTCQKQEDLAEACRGECVGNACVAAPKAPDADTATEKDCGDKKHAKRCVTKDSGKNVWYVDECGNPTSIAETCLGNERCKPKGTLVRCAPQ
jgi:hypothetical protein